MIDGIYSDSENLKVVFSYLIFNVSSINKKYGRLSKFIEEFKLQGQTNGKLYVIAEMCEPHDYLFDLVHDELKELKFKENEDYVFGYEYLVKGFMNSNKMLNREIPEFKNIDWIGSYITYHGNYVWYIDPLKQKENNFLTFQENNLEGIPPKKHYQKLLFKYFEYFKYNLEVFNPKIINVDDHYVFFHLKNNSFSNGIRRVVLDRYNQDIFITK